MNRRMSAGLGVAGRVLCVHYRNSSSHHTTKGSAFFAFHLHILVVRKTALDLHHPQAPDGPLFYFSPIRYENGSRKEDNNREQAVASVDLGAPGICTGTFRENLGKCQD
ncbi:hypothetical protein DdX_00421 [Ditylenchus destructor]|uniref:Uncharacterized protein n=1 Tax=Ditylenchus destructor TaxID=166010 RepID=A0AAD4RD81_9BILA|nr:hypothetical protein DdX_00421 [Ditylenchus destructor]